MRRTYSVTDQAAEVRRAKKDVPFTVTTIGGKKELAEWKLDQAKKYETWKSESAQRYLKRRANAIAIVKEERKPGVDKNQAAFERYKAEQLELERQHVERQNLVNVPTPKPTESLFNRICNAISNWFLSIKF